MIFIIYVLGAIVIFGIGAWFGYDLKTKENEYEKARRDIYEKVEKAFRMRF